MQQLEDRVVPFFPMSSGMMNGPSVSGFVTSSKRGGSGALAKGWE